jgi:hypothetical protein
VAVSSAIIGREAELRAVERFLDGLAAEPRALVLDGEAGIGKTTLWLAAVAAAGARSFRVLQARPSESEARLSYAALADLVGTVFEDWRAALPPVQERALAAALLRADADEAADARTTATALVTVLGELAAEAPTLVAIDDVQWLDAASARALEFAARRLPPGVGLLLTRRTDHESEPPLGLRRSFPEDRLERLVPGPLSLGALHHLISTRLGTSPGRRSSASPRPRAATRSSRSSSRAPRHWTPGNPSAGCVRVLAVSVDPAGDTPRAIRRFVRTHALLPEFRYLTGTPAALRQVWRSYGIRARGGARGPVEHTLFILLVDRRGRGRVLYDASAQPAAIVHDVRLLLAGA